MMKEGCEREKARKTLSIFSAKSTIDQVCVLEWQMNNGLEGNKQ